MVKSNARSERMRALSCLTEPRAAHLLELVLAGMRRRAPMKVPIAIITESSSSVAPTAPMASVFMMRYRPERTTIPAPKTTNPTPVRMRSIWPLL